MQIVKNEEEYRGRHIGPHRQYKSVRIAYEELRKAYEGKTVYTLLNSLELVNVDDRKAIRQEDIYGRTFAGVIPRADLQEDDGEGRWNSMSFGLA